MKLLRLSDRLVWTASTVVVLLALGCQGQPASSQTQQPVARQDSSFAQLVAQFSERGGYFDTDNLISNETSYLHVMGTLKAMDIKGGAYIGVGPDQNFSYMAQIRPEIAFMVDIRRDNLLQHLFFKALFTAANTRVEYLSLLIGKPAPSEISRWTKKSLEDLISYLDETPVRPDDVEHARHLVLEHARHTGLALSDADLQTIGRIHDAFIRSGLSLRFTSHGRAPRSHYPTYRRLLLETDWVGNPANYLVDEDDFRFLKQMHEQDRIVPVVGDLAGPHALQAIAEWLHKEDVEVSAFYTSNVEFYLMRYGTFDQFGRNIMALPWQENGVLIRSYFNYFGASLPYTKAGYGSTQLLQTAASFSKAQTQGGYPSYSRLITDDALELR